MAYTPPFGAGDAVAAQTLDKLKVFTDWLAANGQQGKGIITEMGIPGSSIAATDPIPGSGTGAKFDIRWDNVVQQWYEAANRASLGVTAWNASNWRVDLRAYETDDGTNKPLNYRTTFSSVIENNLTNGSYVRGVNFAGAEFSDRGPNGSLDLSKTEQPGAGYYYPDPVDIAMLAGRGLDVLRIPIRWERIQTTLKGPLNTTEMAKLDVVVKACKDNKIKCLLDMHNYARYDTTPTGSNANGVYILGQNAPATHNGSTVGGTMISCYVDVWTKLAQYYSGNTGMWGYDIMNEPHDCPNGRSDWQEASRQVVEAIRLVDGSIKIAVEGYLYASVPGWLSENGSSAWLTTTIPSGQQNAGKARNTDPNILWNGHHYFDSNYNGGFEDSYDSELSSASNAGYQSYSTSGYTAPATKNTLQTGQRTQFATVFDGNDFYGTYDKITTGTNTIELPYKGDGNPASSMRILATKTSDEGSAKKVLGAANAAREIKFDFKIPTGSTVVSTGNFAIAHFWRDDTSTDLVEVRVVGNGAGYNLGLTIPSGSYAFVNSLATVLPLGSFNNVRVVVTDTDIKLYVNGATTPEATITGSYSGVNVGAAAYGKYYGQAYEGYMLFDNLIMSSTATAYAPPNGGLLPNSATTPTNPGSGGSAGTNGGGGTTNSFPIQIQSWYANGVKPNKTLAQLQTIARTRYDMFMNFCYEETSGVPTGTARIKAPDQDFEGDGDKNATVSEGMGYGMLACAFFGNSNLPTGVYDSTARAKFDKMWKYYKYYEDGNGLMNWHISSTGTIKGNGGASDGDFDVAMSLIVAHRNWGDNGAINYGQEATTLINAILTNEIVPLSGQSYPNRFRNGDLWSFASTNPYYTDYFSPGWFREFYNHTGNTRWLDIIDVNYASAVGSFYNTGNPLSNTSGLITDVKMDLSAPYGSNVFGYNSIRYGWRITADYVWNGSNTNSLAYNAMNRLVTAQKSRYSNSVQSQKAEPQLDYSSTGNYINSGYVQAFGAGSVVSSTHSQWGADTMDYLANDTSNSYFGNGLCCMTSMLLAGIMQQGTSANGLTVSTGVTGTLLGYLYGN